MKKGYKVKVLKLANFKLIQYREGKFSSILSQLRFTQLHLLQNIYPIKTLITMFTIGYDALAFEIIVMIALILDF
jgi:hypothetical protein